MMTNMAGNGVTMGRLRRTLDDLIIAEMFLVQATIESATAFIQIPSIRMLIRKIARHWN